MMISKYNVFYVFLEMYSEQYAKWGSLSPKCTKFGIPKDKYKDGDYRLFFPCGLEQVVIRNNALVISAEKLK